jgi:cobalamin biosynthesis protein CobD/CbiB
VLNSVVISPNELSTLMRKEIELAKVEAKEEFARAGKGAGMFAGAGVAAWLALLFLTFGLAWLLDQAMNTALAFALVGVLWAVVGAVLALRGKAEIKKVEPLPTTVQTLKEDVEWAKEQKS